MIKRKPSSISSFAALSFFEMLLVIFMACHGGWQLQIAWDSPSLVGWIPSGTLLMTSSIACAWLIYKRRGTQRSTLLPMVFFMNSSSLLKNVLEWHAKKEDAEWPTIQCILVALILTALIAEEITHRKFTAKDADRESKLFDQEDRL